MWTILSKSLLNCHSIASVPFLFFFFFFFLTVRQPGSLGLQPGIEHIPPVLEGEVLTAGLLGQSLKIFSSLLNKTFELEVSQVTVSRVGITPGPP